MSTYSNLKIEEITLGDSGWGTSTTNNLLAIQQALQSATLATGDFSSNVATLPWTNTSATTNTPRAMILNITATLTGAGTLNMPAITGGKAYLVVNNSAGGFAVTVKVTGLTGVSVPNGKAMWLWNNGTDIVDGVNYISSLALGAALPLTSGGTGGTTAGAARTNLGATTLGSNLFTVTDPGAITFPRFNADNSVSTLNAADFRTAIGAGTGSGSVTSVAMTVPTGLAISGTPITSSGTLALSLAGGYSIPTTASQTNWDSAYTQRLQWDGGSTNLAAATGRASLGLGTMATQNASAVAVTGGTVSGTKVVSRVTALADSTSVTVDSDTTDIALQGNTQATGTLTINNPSGTPYAGQRFIFRLRSTNVQTFSWGTEFAGSTDLALPTASTGANKFDYMGFIWNGDVNKWQLLAKNFGF